MVAERSDDAAISATLNGRNGSKVAISLDHGFDADSSFPERMKHFPPPQHRPREPDRKRLDFRQWLVIVASPMAGFLVPFLLVLLLERR